MDDKTKNIQPEIENLNLDEIDVEELEKRLELAAAAATGGCLANGCAVKW
jgi:translation initiation factor 1 (eIF-1/SUI1)